MALFLKALVAMVVAWAGCALPAAAQTHVTEALVWPSPSTAWMPPQALDAAALDAADRAVLDAATPWQPVALPHARPRARWGGLGQSLRVDVPEVLWYRMQLPAEALDGMAEGVRLYLPRWQTVGTLGVYVGGRLAWQSGGGDGDRLWNGFNHPVWIDLGGLARPGGPAQVHVRMASLPGVGGMLSSLWAGPAQELLPSWRWRTFWQTSLVSYWRAGFLMLSLFALALWFKYRRSRRDEVRLFLLFFVMSACQSVAALLFLVDDEGLDVDFAWFSWLTLVALLAALVCMFHFLCRVQGQHWPRLGRALPLYLGVVAVLTLPTWWSAYLALVPLLRLLLAPAVLALLVAVAVGAWRLRSRSSLMLAVWAAMVPPIGLHDMAMQSYRFDVEGVYLSPYVSVGLFMLFLVIVFTRYSRAQDLAARAHATLAERLAAQERELLQAHERLRLAEREQTLLHERQRLMREMHDGVGSSLISALRLVEEAPADTVDVAQMLRECIDDLKLSIDSLEPVHADLLALLAALRFRLGPRLEGAGLALRWQVSDLPPLPWLDAQSALHVLRILQEVLTNIVKHSGADDIAVGTMEAARNGMPGVQVWVRDNGRPFIPPVPEALPPGRRGLGNVRSRARALGAHCDWQPAPARGTEFTLWLPLYKQRENADTLQPTISTL
ncbi:sensor histidine kinase [Diaphorobacter ruginosibacter]|nr:ATP-binding protein [Diaphorobacter ruginosibacter]